MSVFVKIFQVYDVDTEADDAVAAADDDVDVDADSMIAMMNSVQNYTICCCIFYTNHND